jgi:uroporphyrinogen-III synthase
MVRQSQHAVLLTRPLAASQRFAQGLQSRVVISPLMQAEFLVPAIPDRVFAGVVFTAETGVEAAQYLKLSHALPAYCVGKRTAEAAQAAGWQALSANGDVGALAALISAQKPEGTLLILRPEHVAGDLGAELLSAGIETVSLTAYRQRALPLTSEAAALLHGSDPVFVPLFSPRSARLFAAEYRRIAAVAPIFVAAMSAAVIAELDIPAQDSEVAERPDAASMRQALAEIMRRWLGA